MVIFLYCMGKILMRNPRIMNKGMKYEKGEQEYIGKDCEICISATG